MRQRNKGKSKAMLAQEIMFTRRQGHSGACREDTDDFPEWAWKVDGTTRSTSTRRQDLRRREEVQRLPVGEKWD